MRTTSTSPSRNFARPSESFARKRLETLRGCRGGGGRGSGSPASGEGGVPASNSIASPVLVVIRIHGRLSTPHVVTRAQAGAPTPPASFETLRLARDVNNAGDEKSEFFASALESSCVATISTSRPYVPASTSVHSLPSASRSSRRDPPSTSASASAAARAGGGSTKHEGSPDAKRTTACVTSTFFLESC